MKLILTYIVPIVLPTALYMLWLLSMQERDRRAGRPVTPHDPPWAWLLIAGFALTAVVLLATLLFDESPYLDKAPPSTGEWTERPVRPVEPYR